MCKQLKDILFPLNVLGKKMKSIAYPLSDELTDEELQIVWAGERLQVSWTEILTIPNPRKKIVASMRFMYTDSEGKEESIIVRRGLLPHGERVTVTDNKVFFLCTNVTSLIVNGQTLI